MHVPPVATSYRGCGCVLCARYYTLLDLYDIVQLSRPDLLLRVCGGGSTNNPKCTTGISSVDSLIYIYSTRTGTSSYHALSDAAAYRIPFGRAVRTVVCRSRAVLSIIVV
jgi:hypothetical protein